jgi:hypothetical protein
LEVDRRARKPWITQEIINQIDRRRDSNSVNKEEGRKSYRRLRNELRRATDEQRRSILRGFTTIFLEFQRAGCFDLMYTKTKALRWNEKHGIQDSELKTLKGRL